MKKAKLKRSSSVPAPLLAEKIEQAAKAARSEHILVEFPVTCGASAKLQDNFEKLTPALRKHFLVEVLRTVLSARGCDKEAPQRKELNMLFGYNIANLICAGGCQLAVYANIINWQIDICFVMHGDTPKYCQLCVITADNTTFGRICAILSRKLRLRTSVEAPMEGPTYLPVTDFPFAK